jgi:hypothetical protein
MIKKLILHLPNGSVRMFDSVSHQITVTDTKVIVKSGNGEEEEFVGMPIAASHGQVFERPRSAGAPVRSRSPPPARP